MSDMTETDELAAAIHYEWTLNGHVGDLEDLAREAAIVALDWVTVTGEVDE